MMIDLAHAGEFILGGLRVVPAARTVWRGDWREFLEPRVMQVLVALRAGQVVSRDDLIARCWGGRIVGDDAIDRAIGKLRRLAASDNGNSFVIETIPRVGYRLRQRSERPAPVASGGIRATLSRAALMLAVALAPAVAR